MECDVCERHIGPILDGFCFWCVRGVLHGPRQAMVAVLLQREKIVKQIESALGSGDSTYDLHLSDLYGEITKSRRMKESIGQRILSLRTALQTGRRWADERREALSRNRQSQVRFQDDMEKQRETFAVQKSCAIMPDQQAEAIAFEKRRHARQLGRLLSIQHQMTDTLILSNIRIPRLCDLNEADPRELNAAFFYVAHFAHQLSRDCYDLSFRVALSEKPGAPGILLSRYAAKTNFRPMTLPDGRRLSKLAREDSLQYEAVVEGISLLIWTISWLCRQHGLSHDRVSSLEDVCDVGSHLWKLVGASKAKSQSSASANLSYTSGSRLGRSIMGQWSSPEKLIGAVKSALLAERQGAEWDILEADENHSP